MALSSAAEPEASPGARIGPGVPVSKRTPLWPVEIAGVAYVLCDALAEGSRKSSKLLVAEVA